MKPISYIRNFFCALILLSLQSCFLIKIPVKIVDKPIKDTVNVYHFIISDSRKKVADTNRVNTYKKESKKAYEWISKQASLNDQRLIFKETWAQNKDSALKNTFVYKMPKKSLKVLIHKKRHRIITQKKKKDQKEITKIVNWEKNLFDSLATSVKDSLINNAINQMHSTEKDSRNSLFVVHLIKVKKSRVEGFYGGQKAFIGDNTSRTIAHESLHHLGAHDLYIHKYWIGKRCRIVRKEFKEEIMYSTFPKNNNCYNSYVSKYTAYCMGWTKKTDQEGKPLLKQNLQAKFDFWLTLILPF